MASHQQEKADVEGGFWGSWDDRDENAGLAVGRPCEERMGQTWESVAHLYEKMCLVHSNFSHPAFEYEVNLLVKNNWVFEKVCILRARPKPLTFLHRAVCRKCVGNASSFKKAL